MKFSPVDIALDSLFWVACVALPASLISHLLRIPTNAFIAGILATLAILALGITAKVNPHLRPTIALRIAQISTGAILGVLA